MIIKSSLTGQQYQFPDDFDRELAGQLIKDRESNQVFSGRSMVNQRLNPAPIVAPTVPTLRDRLGSTIRGGLEDAGFSRNSARGVSEGFQNISDFIPMTASAYAGDSFGREVKEEDYLGAAGSLAEGALEVNPVTSAVGDAAMFIGAKSKLFNKEAADLAEEMKSQGATRSEIWEATGNQYGAPMIHGYDGKLRQEITDEGAELSTDTKGLIDMLSNEGGDVPIGKAFLHDDFFGGYSPELKPSTAMFQEELDDGFLGSYSPKPNLLTARLKDGEELTPEDSLASTMLHEIQHLAQATENFSSGGNPDVMSFLPRIIDSRRKSLSDKINNLNVPAEIDEGARGVFNIIPLIDKKMPHSGYEQSNYIQSNMTAIEQLRRSGLLPEANADRLFSIIQSPEFMDVRNGMELRKEYNDYLKSKIPQIEANLGFKISDIENPSDYQSILSKVIDSTPPDLKAEYKKRSELMNEMARLNQATQEINNRYDGGTNTFRMYRDIYGEQEARMTQDRQNMSMLDRIGQPPQYNDAGISIDRDGRVSFVFGSERPNEDNSVVLGELSEFISKESANPRGLMGQIDTSYRGSHTAPYRDDEGYHSSLDDLTSMYGDDIYTGNALRYFGEGRDYDKKAIDIIQRMAGNPDAEITIYRALPKGKNEINPRDWVTTTREYALEHIGDDEGYHIVSKKVKASDVFSEGNSIHEFGYDPLEK